METIEPEIISTAFKTVVGKKSYMQGFGAGLSSSSSIRVQHLQGELDAQRIETENARKECNEIRAKLVEVESQLEEERRKRKEVEARLLDRQKEMQEINNQVQTAIQSALSQYRPPVSIKDKYILDFSILCSMVQAAFNFEIMQFYCDRSRFFLIVLINLNNTNHNNVQMFS